MIKALAIKELRESVGIVAVAAIGMAWVVGRCMGVNPLQAVIPGAYNAEHLAFLDDNFYSMAILFVGGLAVLLGLKQSALEIHQNTFHFLFHRPLSRRRILATKLIVGAFLVFSVIAAAILVYGSWAAMPGHLAAPFDWSMTTDTWKLAATLPLVYLGGFLSGIRPGHWFGTRLIPLAAAAVWSFVISMVIFWWLQLPLLLIGYACGLIAIDSYTETRDY